MSSVYVAFDYKFARSITPSDTTTVYNLIGARWISCTVAGNVSIRQATARGAATPVVIPLSANTWYSVGTDMESVLSTSTTATGIIAGF